MFLHQVYRLSHHVCDLFPESDRAVVLPLCTDLLKTEARGVGGKDWGAASGHSSAFGTLSHVYIASIPKQIRF